MDAGSSKSDIIKAPSATLLGDTTSGQSSLQALPRRRRYVYLRRWLPYLSGLAIRVATLIVIIAVLIGLGLGLQYTEGMPRAEDFTHLTFDWHIDPSSFLSPFNSTFGSYNVLLDGHSHSTYSDGKMNVDQLLDWHLANGYNAVIVTDHNTIKGGLAAEELALNDERYKDRIVVIPGIEYTCCRIHMNLININESVPIGPPEPSDEQLQQVIRRVHELGGLVIVNHIPWSNTTQGYYEEARLPNHPSVEDLISWGVDGFEVVHDSTFDYSTYQATVAHNLIQMVGTDVHHPSMGASTWLTVQAANFTRQGVMDAIQTRKTSFLMDPAGTRPIAYPDSNPKYDMLMPLTGLGPYFNMFYTDNKGMYSFQGTFCHPEKLDVHGNIIGWFIFWLFIMVLVYELVRVALIYGSTWIMQRIKRRHFAS
ncbi:PHP domain-like protein, partial [Lichtheimia hyalospora FSU 10163]